MPEVDIDPAQTPEAKTILKVLRMQQQTLMQGKLSHEREDNKKDDHRDRQTP